MVKVLSNRLMPIILVLFYQILTVFLYYWGPMEWPLYAEPWVLIFLVSVSCAFAAGSVFGVRGVAQPQQLRHWKKMILFGGALSLVLLFPSSFYYTGKMPWQVIDALLDQGATYSALAQKLEETDGQRTLISLARSLSYPIIFATLSFGILRWKQMSFFLWLAWLFVLVSFVVFSILRGTDREIFDIVIVVGASCLVVGVRDLNSHGSSVFAVLFNRKAFAFVIGVSVLGALVFGVFSDRRLGRTGLSEAALTSEISTEAGWLRKMCIRKTCANPNHPLMQASGTRLKYGVAMFSGYLSQGYFGLSLVLNEEFTSTFGIGHSKALTRVYERITKDERLYERSYTHRLNNLGWDDSSQWSTIYVWIANDVGFHGTVAVLCVIGFVYGRSWRDATEGGNDSAAIVFCFLAQLVAYIPANNQIAQTYDAYFAFGVWMVIWLAGGFKKSRSPFS